MTETRSPHRPRSQRPPAPADASAKSGADDFAARNQALLERIALLRRQAADTKPADSPARPPQKPARRGRPEAKAPASPPTARSRVEARRQGRGEEKPQAKSAPQEAASRSTARRSRTAAAPSEGAGHEIASRTVPSRRTPKTATPAGKTAGRSTPTRRSGATRQHHLTTPEAPPVLVRRDWATVPLQERSPNRPRRRMDVALNIPGAEVRLPALPEIRLNWRLASGMLALLMLALLFHLWYADAYRVQDIEVTGLERLNGNDLATVMGVLGEPLFAVDPARARQELQLAFPQLKTVSVRIALPDRVKVVVEERQPILGWTQDNKVLWVDAEGVAFTPRGEAEALVMVDAQNSPQGEGKIGDANVPWVDPHLVTILKNMAERAPEGATLAYSADHGLGWNDPHGWQVYFGMDVSNIDAKLLVYQAMVQRFEQDGIQPRMISLENIHAPYYRLDLSSRR